MYPTIFFLRLKYNSGYALAIGCELFYMFITHN